MVHHFTAVFCSSSHHHSHPTQATSWRLPAATVCAASLPPTRFATSARYRAPRRFHPLRSLLRPRRRLDQSSHYRRTIPNSCVALSFSLAQKKRAYFLHVVATCLCFFLSLVRSHMPTRWPFAFPCRSMRMALRSLPLLAVPVAAVAAAFHWSPAFTRIGPSMCLTLPTPRR